MEKGVYLDRRGREITVTKTDSPGKYPVHGIQYTKKKDGISKGGQRTYTAKGKYYANGGSKADALDLDLARGKIRDLCEYDDEAPRKLTYVFKLNGKVVGTSEALEDSDEEQELLDNGWEERD